MALLQLTRVGTGQVAVKPGSVKMVSTENLATVTAANYLKNDMTSPAKAIGLLASDVIEALIDYDPATDSGTLVNLQVSVSSGIITLSVPASPPAIALPSAQILVGNASGQAAAVAMSGDVAISNAGSTTIQAGAIDLAMLSTGITPSHVVKFAGQHTTVGGGAAEAITVTGAAATDLAFVQMVDNGTANVTIIDAVVTLNTLTVTFSGDPGNDAIINYQLLRAAS